MKHIRWTVKEAPDAVTQERWHHGKFLVSSEPGDRLPNNTQRLVRTTAQDSIVKGLFGRLNQIASPFINVTHQNRFGAVPVKSVEKYRHVDVDNVPIHQLSVVRNSVTGHIVDRCADGLWKA